MGAPRIAKSLPLQVAAVCYRRRGPAVEFLLVNTNGGSKWTFPKGNIKPWVGARESAQSEALEEAGAEGSIQNRSFHTYLSSKGVFWRAEGVQEYCVQAYLLEVKRTRMPAESFREPTWCSPARAKELLALRREGKYAQELARTVDEALRGISQIGNSPRRNGYKNGSRTNLHLPLFLA